MLEQHLKVALQETHKLLLENGELLSQEKLHECYSLFRSRFGPEVLGGLQGEALLNLMHARPGKDSLVYWLEFKDDDAFPGRFGSIAGGSALKFGFFWRQETGAWVTGSPQKQSQISLVEAVAFATKQRDQLLAADGLLVQLPPNASDADYATLQGQLDQLCPDVSSNAWGHKYLSLLFPSKLDDYHNTDYQRFHLIKLLQEPPTRDGLYAAAGHYVRIAAELGIPVNHLTTVLNHRYGKPHCYWRIGSSLGAETSIWAQMREGNFVAIGWPELGDLAAIPQNQDIRAALAQRLQQIYGAKPNVASRKAGEIRSFFKGVSEGDLICAAEGRKILAVGRVTGPYRFDPETHAGAPHQRPVEWLELEPWQLPKDEGLQTTFVEIREPKNRLATEFHISSPSASVKPSLSPTMPSSEPDPLPLNIILYGPPGTGKTHRLRNEYMEKYFTDRQAVLTAEEQACAIVKDKAWWEVAALALLDTDSNSATVTEIFQHPLMQARLKISANVNPRNAIWAALQSHSREDCSAVNYAVRCAPFIFAKSHEDAVWSLSAKLVQAEIPDLGEALQQFRNPPKELSDIRRYKFTTFHQSFSYEDFVEGIKPQSVGGQLSYEVRDGIFKQACQEATAVFPKPYALFIDEINRGNVASIFGELITLIEDDKRLGTANQLTPELPYSRQPFGVPRNLHIIGTMNTADRSVEALDTALRRRFVFIEMRPDPKLIQQPAGLNVDLSKLLEAMNARIEQLLDHDHCIGHAYFMSVQDLPDLRRVFANKIVPLLREYFYGSPAKVGMVLGERFVIRQTSQTPFGSGPWGEIELDKKEVYAFADFGLLTEADFQSVYA